MRKQKPRMRKEKEQRKEDETKEDKQRERGCQAGVKPPRQPVAPDWTEQG